MPYSKLGITTHPHDINNIITLLVVMHMVIQFLFLHSQFVSCFRSLTNCAPWVGLVITFAGPMISVARCTMMISFVSTLSFVQKCLMAMCLVLLLVLLPFSIRDMQDMLSWYTVDGPCSYPCAVRKFLRCNNMLVVIPKRVLT